jgi:drug/metabolite transporter (DMT)-like permease
MCVIWGIPYLLIKVAVEDLSPAALVLCRTSIGALLLLPIALARDELRPLVSRWRALLLYTLVELIVPWGLLSTAEQRISSSLAGLIVAAVPLVGFAIVWGLLRDRGSLHARNAIGLVLGFVGVGALVGIDGARADAAAVAMMAAVVIGYAVGPIILSRSLRDMPNLGVVCASLAICALVYTPLALASAPAHMPSGRVVASVLTLGVVCTALAFVLFFALIREVGPVRATTITYVNPAVAAILGVVFLHEDLGAASIVGFALILTGSVLATSRPSRAESIGDAEIGEPVPA